MRYAYIFFVAAIQLVSDAESGKKLRYRLVIPGLVKPLVKKNKDTLLMKF